MTTPSELHSEIPDKLYFKIGEVARFAGVEPYVLRYWETEFKEINPLKSRSNQRLYRRKDIDTVIWIKKLLYDDGFTIDGARRRLRELKEEKEAEGQEEKQITLTYEEAKGEKFLKQVKAGLEEILKVLES